MKFGVREICNVTLRVKASIKLGKKQYYKDEPVFYFDSLKTSTLEGTSTTVYATGGRGNARLVAWEGDRTVTFTMEDALATPETISLLTGSVLEEGEELIHRRLDLHKDIICYATSSTATISNYGILFLSPEELNYKIPHISNNDLTNLYVFIEGENEPFVISQSDYISKKLNEEVVDLDNISWLNEQDTEQFILMEKQKNVKAIVQLTKEQTGTIKKNEVDVPVYEQVKNIRIWIQFYDNANSIWGNSFTLMNKNIDPIDLDKAALLLKNLFIIGNTIPAVIPVDKTTYKSESSTSLAALSYIDYYYKANCKTIAIEPKIHNYNYYLEAETLFRDAATGLDYPAHFIVPNCRLQPNFTFNMANSGDPGTFTFTIDAFPGYIKGGSGTNKVLAGLQIIDDPDVDVKLSEQRKATPHGYEVSSTSQP